MISSELIFGLIVFYFTMFVTPGPNNVMLTISGIKFGFKKTIPHLLGIPLGHFFQISLVSFGLGKIFQQYPIIQNTLKYIGCLYLFYLSYRMFGSIKITEIKDPKARPLKFYEASLFQFLNPKAWIVALTAVSVFFPSNENFYIAVLFVTLIAPIVCLPCISVWAIFGSAIRIFISNKKVKYLIEIVMSLLLIATAIMILL